MHATVTLHQHRRTYKNKTYTYWVLRWRDGDGRRRNQSLGTTDEISKRQAEKLRVQKQLEFEAKPTLRLNSGTTLGELLRDYVRHRRTDLKDGTIELHEQTAKYLKGYFGVDRRLGAITPSDARLFKTELAEGKLVHLNRRHYKRPMSKETVNRHMREARVIFALAVTDGYLANNPFEKMAGGKTAEQEWHYVSVEEFAKLMGAAKPAWKLMLGLARWAGLRLEETVRLTWRQVDMERRRIEIVAHTDHYGAWTPKDHDKRTIPICPELRALLEEARSPDSELVIPVGGVQLVNVWRDFGPLFKAAGVARYSKPMHSLRKSCITDWANSGVAPRSVQEWAGHSDIRTTMAYYAKVVDSEFEKVSGVTQKVTQKAETGSEATPEPVSENSSVVNFTSRAGEGIRTLDVQLGKLAFYH